MPMVDYVWTICPWVNIVELCWIVIFLNLLCCYGGLQCYITMFPNHYVTLLRSVGVLLLYDVHQCLHCIWHPSMVLWHNDAHQSWCCIVTSINGNVTLQHSSKLMSHCDIKKWLYCDRHQILHHIISSMDVYVTMWCASMYRLQCDI